MQIQNKHINRCSSLMENHGGDLFDSLADLLDEDEYFAKNFSDIPESRWADLMDFLVRIHADGVMFGMIIAINHRKEIFRG
jgi:hypothetical protein